MERRAEGMEPRALVVGYKILVSCGLVSLSLLSLLGLVDFLAWDDAGYGQQRVQLVA